MHYMDLYHYSKPYRDWRVFRIYLANLKLRKRLERCIGLITLCKTPAVLT